jgi:hypothetical protein
VRELAHELARGTKGAKGNLKEFPDRERARETSAIKFLVLLVLCIRGNVVESSTEDPQGP